MKRFAYYLTLLSAFFIFLQRASAADNCRSLYTTGMAGVYQAIQNCEAAGETGGECRQDPDIVNQTNEIAGFYYHCTHWSPQQGYTVPMPAPTLPVATDVTIECTYYVDSSDLDAYEIDCTITYAQGRLEGPSVGYPRPAKSIPVHSVPLPRNVKRKRQAVYI